MTLLEKKRERERIIITKERDLIINRSSPTKVKATSLPAPKYICWQREPKKTGN